MKKSHIIAGFLIDKEINYFVETSPNGIIICRNIS